MSVRASVCGEQSFSETIHVINKLSTGQSGAQQEMNNRRRELESYVALYCEHLDRC